MLHSAAGPKFRAVEAADGADAIFNIFKNDGCVVIKHALSPEQVKTLNAEIDIPMSKIDAGSDKTDPEIQEFHGAQTKRLTNLVTHSRVLREEILNHDLIHSVCEAVFKADSGDYWMTTAQAIDIGPGNKAQPLHRDLAQYPIFINMGRDGPEAIINFFIALTEFTAENGATRCIPGSHRDENLWDFGQPENTVPAVMEAGDIFLFCGKLIHGGGVNRTTDFVRRAISLPFQASYLTPEEAYPFLVDKDIVKSMPPRAQKMIGFRSVFPKGSPGLWQSDGRELATILGL
ncbi:uncharacterized protein Z520_05939 [Fonsecaea multimorphosa CBS 102226]|uniref:Fe2OG dioxygenase domain-containing protein n=1 Tax=Fonsecaea multimorphosa CBS 102226 TaxID=1442371 RepID=A0A0D2KPI9_9EURO|nr:uncharacterized protein Z520_05939 [Fonsecaea multimorphosa CBS 102226]KIX98638.1 hypothetical protein Z520_05939 [Fonsecaea multimorphosa CBS 102226]OAL24827.1 hypothetical protein AYO22_05616 [Fonsecaea multimorphosa]